MATHFVRANGVRFQASTVGVSPGFETQSSRSVPGSPAFFSSVHFKSPQTPSATATEKKDGSLAIEVCPRVKTRFPLKPTRENQRNVHFSKFFSQRLLGLSMEDPTPPLDCLGVSKPGYSRALNQSAAGPDQFLPVASLSLRCSSGRTPGPLQEGSSTATATRSRENLSHGAGRPAAYQAEEAQRRQQEGAIGASGFARRNGHGSKPTVPCWHRCTTHISCLVQLRVCLFHYLWLIQMSSPPAELLKKTRKQNKTFSREADNISVTKANPAEGAPLTWVRAG